MYVKNILIFSFIYLCVLESDIFFYIFHVVCELHYDSMVQESETQTKMVTVTMANNKKMDSDDHQTTSDRHGPRVATMTGERSE